LSGVLDRAFDQPLHTEEYASSPLAGGIMQHGFQCGMIWGASLAGGAEAYRRFGSGAEAESGAVTASRRAVESFRTIKQHINCIDIIHLDKSSSKMDMMMFFLIKGGMIGCLRLASKYAPIAFNEIDTTLSEKKFEIPELPISCSSILARKLGMSDRHVTMASGFAGGIGLSGGACGALGAAIWIRAVNDIKGGAQKVEFVNPGGMEIVDRFLRGSDFKFKCSEIVGRKFESVSDHADYIREGGCKEIIEALAID